MMTLLVILGIIQTLALAGVFLFRKDKQVEQSAPPPPDVSEFGKIQAAQSAALSKQYHEVMATLKQLPEVTLHTIQGSANSHKGKFGELIGYINLKAQYDRIIPLGSIVDFMAITYPRDGKPGKIDFIDIKTGENARLTKDQRAMKQLLINKNINFVTMKIDSIEGMDDGPDTDRSTT